MSPHRKKSESMALRGVPNQSVASNPFSAKVFIKPLTKDKELTKKFNNLQNRTFQNLSATFDSPCMN